MKALLLAAGRGTRLRPITENLPKCLVPINGKPLIEYWLKLLRNGGVHPILVNTHYFAGKVSKYITESSYGDIVKTVYEDKLLGTAGTLLKNKLFFGDNALMLVHADNLSVFNVQAFIKRHENRPQGCLMTMMTFMTSTPSTCGIVELDRNDVVKAFHEKVKNPPGNLANAAVYILEPAIFGFLEKLRKECIDFSTEVLPNFIGKIYTFHNDIYHRDIGTLESYTSAKLEAHELSRKGLL